MMLGQVDSDGFRWIVWFDASQFGWTCVIHTNAQTQRQTQTPTLLHMHSNAYRQATPIGPQSWLCQLSSSMFASNNVGALDLFRPLRFDIELGP